MKPTFAQMADWSGGVWHREPATAFNGVCIDTRKISKGALFVALRGSSGRDGHDYLAAAAEAGAAAALVTRVDPAVHLPQLKVDDATTALQAIARNWRDRFPGTVIAITGSCGKTSTKDLLALLLSGEAPVCATMGNLNNELGVPLSLLALDPDLHRFAVIEAGINQPGEMQRLGNTIHADKVILTMIGAAHLELLGSLEGIAREKTALIRSARNPVDWYCPADCMQYNALHRLPGRGHVTFYPGDQPSSCNYKQNQAGRCLRVEFSRAVASASPFITPESAIELVLHPEGEQAVTVHLPPMSDGMVHNAALAIWLALDLGLSVDVIQRQLRLWQAPEQRGQHKVINGRCYYVDCYNANPSSLQDSARYFVQLHPQPPRTFIIGGMRELGIDSKDWHYQCGFNLPVQSGDRIIAIGAETEPLLQGVREARRHADLQCHHFFETAAAATLLQDGTEPVFIKGSRAHALETLVPCSAN